MDEVAGLKARYAKQIEDGRRIEVFTSMPEWQWYVERVVQPTIDEYTKRVMSGKINSEKEDWVIRGMVMGMKLVIDSPSSFKLNAKEARKKAKALQKAIEDEA